MTGESLGSPYPRPADEETPGRRNLSGWIFLAGLFALMIYAQLAGSITHATRAKMDELDGRLKLIVREEPRGSKSALSRLDTDNPKEELHALETQLAREKNLDDLGRALYAAVLTEEHKPVPIGIDRALLASKSPAARAFGRVYAPGKLSRAQAATLQAQLAQSKTFVAKLAAVQALEKAGDRTARDRLLPPESHSTDRLESVGLLAALGLSVFTWFGYFAARAGGELPPKGLRNGALTAFQADVFAIRAAQLVAGWLLIGLVCGVVFGGGTSPQAAEMFTEGALMLAYVPLVFRLPLGSVQLSLAGLGVTKENLGRNILWGLGGFFAELPVAAMLSILVLAMFRFLPTPEHPAERELQHGTNLVTTAAILFLGTIVAAFWEETMFRGLLFPALGRLCKSLPVGALISSLIFAAIHPQGAAVWPSLCVMALMSCALSYQTRSLIPSMVMHFCHNSVLMVLTILASR